LGGKKFKIITSSPSAWSRQGHPSHGREADARSQDQVPAALQGPEGSFLKPSWRLQKSWRLHHSVSAYVQSWSLRVC
jgi:hypothetical protein